MRKKTWGYADKTEFHGETLEIHGFYAKTKRRSAGQDFSFQYHQIIGHIVFTMLL